MSLTSDFFIDISAKIMSIYRYVSRYNYGSLHPSNHAPSQEDLKFAPCGGDRKSKMADAEWKRGSLSWHLSWIAVK